MKEVKHLTEEQFNVFMEDLKDCLFKASDFIQSLEKYESFIDLYNEQGITPSSDQRERARETVEELIALFEKIELMVS